MAEEEENYEVEIIIGKGLDDKGNTIYKVKWKGYPDSESTWEHLSSLDQSMDLVNAYNAPQKHHQQQPLPSLVQPLSSER